MNPTVSRVRNRVMKLIFQGLLRPEADIELVRLGSRTADGGFPLPVWTLYTPRNSAHASHSVKNLQHTDTYVEADLKVEGFNVIFGGREGRGHEAS